MDEHTCLQERTIGKLEESQRIHEKASEKLFKILEGNGDDGGLVSSVKLLSQKIDQIPSPTAIKTYAFFGGGAFLVVCFVGMVIFKSITA